MYVCMYVCMCACAHQQNQRISTPRAASLVVSPPPCSGYIQPQNPLQEILWHTLLQTHITHLPIRLRVILFINWFNMYSSTLSSGIGTRPVDQEQGTLVYVIHYTFSPTPTLSHSHLNSSPSVACDGHSISEAWQTSTAQDQPHPLDKQHNTHRNYMYIQNC